MVFWGVVFWSVAWVAVVVAVVVEQWRRTKRTRTKRTGPFFCWTLEMKTGRNARKIFQAPVVVVVVVVLLLLLLPRMVVWCSSNCHHDHCVEEVFFVWPFCVQTKRELLVRPR